MKFNAAGEQDSLRAGMVGLLGRAPACDSTSFRKKAKEKKQSPTHIPLWHL